MGESSNAQYQKLPPGWDTKYDQATGNCYYINYLTKAMQLEDPRIRYKQLQNERCSTESIAMQPMGGSPYHVYPSNNLPAMRAFHAGGSGSVTNTTLQNISSSPLLSSRGNLEMSPLPFNKSSLLQQTPRTANMSRRSTIQETSFTNQINTDETVAKIQTMFPTASENHIRMLLRRYYNREAVVISALQVEKHPVTMPGPSTPGTQRHLFHSNSAFHMTPPARRLADIGASGGIGVGGASGRMVGSACGANAFNSRTASPIPLQAGVVGRFGGVMSMQSGFGCTAVMANPVHGSPQQWHSSPKPHSSPKMKLRYMKNIFPKADEMLLLDILANVDNNVQQASEKLIELGYTKREFVTPVVNNRPPTTAAGAAVKKPSDEKYIPLRPKEYTQEEKEYMQQRLQEQYPHIAERIILMALESVNYAEDRAAQILQIVHEEDEPRARNQTTGGQTTEADECATDAAVAACVSGAAAGSAADKNSQRDSTEEHASGGIQTQEFKSLLGRIATKGHKNELVKGADEKLLLADYVTWNGANPDISLGHKQLATGSDGALLSERTYVPHGRNSDLCKGPKVGLAKGSIYAQLAGAAGGTKSANIKCN